MTLDLTPFQFEVAVAAVKVLAAIGIVLGMVPMMVLWERKLIAYMQQRPGPNRVGPWGILQTIVDGLKLFLKENIVPASADKILHALAPIMNVVPALVLLAVLPVGPVINMNPADLNFSLLGLTVNFPNYSYDLALGISDVPLGILFYLAVSGLGVYGIVLGGWASNSKYALLGGIRASAQMLSYELAIGLSILGLLLSTGTIDLRAIANQQGAGFWYWNIFTQPVGFFLFLVAGFAETNRLPFDLPEGESELGAGFHTEFSSMKFALFMLSEYVNIIVFSVLIATMFLGGFNAPHPSLMIFAPGTVLYAVVGVIWLFLKFAIIFTFMVIVRGTLPRFRYDQLMDLGWKLMLPVALINLVVTAVVLTFGFIQWPSTDGNILRPGIILLLLLAGIIQIVVIDRYLTIKKRKLLASC